MANYDLETSTSKKPDGYANLFVTVANGDATKDMQVGRFGIALDRSRKLDNLIIKMAESNPEALVKLMLSLKVTVLDESNSSDELELVLK